MLRKIGRIVALCFIGVLIVAIFYDYWWRCSLTGISRDAALAVANEKLRTQDKKIDAVYFELKSAQKEGGDWMFTYEAKDCVIDIIINKCGVADVGGGARGCFNGFHNLNKE